ncbi:DNA-deoxyinosine glycosylase [Marinospirillum sp.]|uniref:DNA-deoxyinosine glycosylase n=1 Tax=Marinospirillum sp. TaxID=2183934 RepID=UPI0038517731
MASDSDALQPVNSFAPVEPTSCRLLILGSMPGKASLAATEYYAHPRNAFWPIMAELLGFDPKADYRLRTQALQEAGIGLWDVMQSCLRPSSLDSDILETSIIPNDFPGWFQRHPHTHTVLCNGGKAFQSYQRHVRPLLDEPFRQLPLYQLPSTSPAHASLTLQQKRLEWHKIMEEFLS